MRHLIHISDLHFGQVRPELLESLRREISQAPPDLLIVSGDLTRRASPSEFQSAHRFLESLPCRKLVVPGNRDVPFGNILLRLLNPLARYTRYISADLSPTFEDNEISVHGLTTAHGRTIGGGRFDEADLRKILKHWEKLPPTVLRILVSHHPLPILTTEKRMRRLGYRIQLPAHLELARHADLVLSGLDPQKRMGPMEQVHLTPQRSIVTLEAGSAISSRFPEEPNSYNDLIIKNGEICFEKRTWDEQAKSFLAERAKRFFSHRGFGEDQQTRRPEAQRSPLVLTDF